MPPWPLLYAASALLAAVALLVAGLPVLAAALVVVELLGLALVLLLRPGR